MSLYPRGRGMAQAEPLEPFKQHGWRQIQGTPLAQKCYWSDLSASAQAQCAPLQDEWIVRKTTNSLVDPVNVISPYWMNRICSPFDAASGGSCTLGNLPSYAVNVSSAEDVVAGVRLAEKNNIRLVIKNTGHHFLGRSSGEGALSLWTHNMK